MNKTIIIYINTNMINNIIFFKKNNISPFEGIPEIGDKNFEFICLDVSLGNLLIPHTFMIA